MKATIRYFASIREALGSSEAIELPEAKRTPQRAKLAWFASKFERLSRGYRRGNASAAHEVENSMCGNWGHARSQRDLLGATDSDGAVRRIDFLGRVESFSRDLRALLSLLTPSGPSGSQQGA